MITQPVNKQTTTDYLKNLSRAGYRVTKSREMLVTLLQLFEDVFTVQDILDTQIIKNQNIHTATIYRDLALFRDLGWVRELSFATCNEHYYEWNPSQYLAMYVNCEECGKASHVSLTPSQVQNISSCIAREVFSQTSTCLATTSAQTIKVYGVCTKCTKAPKEQS